jgi:hypothetical protein
MKPHSLLPMQYISQCIAVYRRGSEMKPVMFSEGNVTWQWVSGAWHEEMSIKSLDFRLLLLWFFCAWLGSLERCVVFFYYPFHLTCGSCSFGVTAVKWCPEYSNSACKIDFLRIWELLKTINRDASKPFAFNFKMIWPVILHVPHFVGGFVIPSKFCDHNYLCIFHFPIYITAHTLRVSTVCV